MNPFPMWMQNPGESIDFVYMSDGRVSEMYPI